MDLAHIFAYNLRVYRTRMGLTQKEFAERVDIPYYYMNRIETSTCVVNLKTVEKISKALNVPAYTFLLTPDFPAEKPPEKPGDVFDSENP